MSLRGCFVPLGWCISLNTFNVSFYCLSLFLGWSTWFIFCLYFYLSYHTNTHRSCCTLHTFLQFDNRLKRNVFDFVRHETEKHNKIKDNQSQEICCKLPFPKSCKASQFSVFSKSEQLNNQRKGWWVHSKKDWFSLSCKLSTLDLLLINSVKI